MGGHAMKGSGRLLLVAGALAALLGGGAARGEGEAERLYRAEIPSWWRDAPELVPAEGELEGLELALREGFADPAAGCFASIQIVDAPLGTKRDSVYRAFREVLGSAGVALTDAEGGGGEGEPLALRLESGTMRGEVRVLTAARAGGGLRAAAAACFYNQREPTVSQTLCNDMLDSFEVMP